ncbi:MAG: hypothetical protein WCW84_14755 [Sulfurimonas sp.]|jgi:hypothetical protein
MQNFQILLLVAGGFIGFVSAVGKDFLLEKSKNKLKEKEFKRIKLEEVFILTKTFFEESIKPIEYRNNTDHSKLPMIIRFYFKNLNQVYNLFLATYQKLQESHFDQEKKDLHENTENFAKQYKLFIDKVVEESKKYY